MVLSILDRRYVSRDDVNQKFTVHVRRVEQIQKIVLNHSISKKISNVFENDSNNLLTIYTGNWRFLLNTVQTAVI